MKSGTIKAIVKGLVAVKMRYSRGIWEKNTIIKRWAETFDSFEVVDEPDTPPKTKEKTDYACVNHCIDVCTCW